MNCIYPWIWKKKKVRSFNHAYAQIEAQHQTSTTTLSQMQTKEREYLSRIQELEQKNNQRYNEILKERDSLKATVDQLEAQIHRQEQYYTKVEQTNRSAPDTKTTVKKDTYQPLLKQISDIQQLNNGLAQERDDYRLKSENTQTEVEHMTQLLQRVEESKIKLIQETAEQINMLRFYLKHYNNASGKQRDL